jgi:hypothetical protein
MTLDCCARHEQELDLGVAQVAQEAGHEPHVSLLLSHGHGWRMLSRASQVYAVARALDLCEAFRAAADRADLLRDRRARAPGLSRSAERANQLT